MMARAYVPAHSSLTSAWYESTHRPPSTGVTYPKGQLGSAVGRENDHSTARVARFDGVQVSARFFDTGG